MDWRVLVVFRSDGSVASDDLVAAVELARPEARPRPASSWDLDPPGPFAGIDVLVQAAGVTDAAARGWEVVRQACLDAAGADLPVWDVRLLPTSSIDVASGGGVPLSSG